VVPGTNRCPRPTPDTGGGGTGAESGDGTQFPAAAGEPGARAAPAADARRRGAGPGRGRGFSGGGASAAGAAAGAWFLTGLAAPTFRTAPHLQLVPQCESLSLPPVARLLLAAALAGKLALWRPPGLKRGQLGARGGAWAEEV
jgi:hypothetical protein